VTGSLSTAWPRSAGLARTRFIEKCLSMSSAAEASLARVARTMFWNLKHKVASADLAEALLDEFIRGATDAPKSPGLDASALARFEDKAHLYKVASVLIALGREEQTNPRFSAVRAEFERRVFPPTYEEGAPLLAAVKSAMKDLSGLFFPIEPGKGISWARNWLLDVGIDERNPIRLFQLATYWLDYHISAAKALQSFKPVQ
jgi:hypothetical protein